LSIKLKYYPLNINLSLALFFLINILSTNHSLCQEHFVISGKVVDITTKRPIENVNLRIIDTGTGTSTDSSGIFYLETNHTNFELWISHISYQTNTLKFDFKKPPNTLEIQLTPKSFELNEAVITAKRQYEYSVTDFDFIDTTILLLVTKHATNSSELYLINEVFDTISKRTNLPANGQASIYKDCMGSCHVIFKDSVYQVFINDKQIQLIYPVSIERFNELMENCLFETPELLVFKNPGLNKFFYSYYAVNKKDYSVNEFISHVDTKRMDALNDELNFIDENPDAFSAAGRVLAIMYAHQIAYKASENYLCRIGDTIYYLNHSNSVLEIFTEQLDFLKEIDILYNQKENWKSEILIDKADHKVYTVFSSGMKYQIAEINLQDGTTKVKQIIPLTFPEKLKINNGYVYFLYKEMGNMWAKKELYQLKL